MVARYLPRMHALQELDLAGTGVSPAGEALLREVQDALGGKLNVLKVCDTSLGCARALVHDRCMWMLVDAISSFTVDFTVGGCPLHLAFRLKGSLWMILGFQLVLFVRALPGVPVQIQKIRIFRTIFWVSLRENKRLREALGTPLFIRSGCRSTGAGLPSLFRIPTP